MKIKSKRDVLYKLKFAFEQGDIGCKKERIEEALVNDIIDALDKTSSAPSAV